MATAVAVALQVASARVVAQREAAPAGAARLPLAAPEQRAA